MAHRSSSAMRFYDSATGQIAGVHSFDDIDVAYESATCVDWEDAIGVWPVPACASAVTKLCRVAP